MGLDANRKRRKKRQRKRKPVMGNYIPVKEDKTRFQSTNAEITIVVKK